MGRDWRAAGHERGRDMSGSIEIMPKQYIIGDYTQSVGEAVDVGGANYVSIQVWIDTAVASGSIKVWLEHASVNDNDSFVDWGTEQRVQFTSGTGTTLIGEATGFSRYLRLRIEFETVTSNYFRAVIILKDAV